METNDADNGDQSPVHMDGIIDDEIEITLESPREQASVGDGIIDDDIELTLESPREQVSVGYDVNNSVLKLAEAGDQLADCEGEENELSEKRDIPTIVITDINYDRGDQGDISDDIGIENKEMKDEFTAIVNETHGDSEHKENMTNETEKQTEFSDILSDASVNTGAVDVNGDEIINDETEILVQQEKESSGDAKKDDGLADNTFGDVSIVMDANSNAAAEVKQQMGDTKSDEGSGEKENTGYKLKKEAIDTAVPLGQHGSNDEVEMGSISLDSIMVREKTGDDSDPDEFDFELPTPKSENNTNKQVTFKDTETTAKKEPSSIKTEESETKSKEVSVETNKDQPTSKDQLNTTISGNKPIAVIKPTTQSTAAAGVDQSKYAVEDDQNQHVLESAQAEWDRVTTITAGYSDKDTGKGSEPVVVETTPAMSPHEMTQYLKTADFSHVQSAIKTGIDRRGLSAFVHMLFGPPKLNRSLLQERDMIFCTAASPLSNENLYHTRTLQTIYRCLTGSKFDCPRTGSHWEEIGFQGTDPATDLRGAGLLGLVNLLQFLKDPKTQGIANDIYRLSLHPTQNFPFCVMGINMSRITLQTLREELLNKECNRRGEVMNVVNEFYVGLYLQMYQVWKNQGKTIQDSGYVIKDLELNAKKNPRQVLRNLDDYLNKKKTVIVADKSPDTGGDNFLSLCDDKT